ncbi:hypothetical protein C8Q74DRAFT_1366981 [Fomes fomentarius]|nr:hypothetical protein C8Q74DRAFT_1366981 [Fomes fomentarius]
MPPATAGSDAIARLRAFPRAPAPNDDAAAVESNLSEADVVLCQNVLAYHVAHRLGSKVFGNGQAKGLKMVAVHVKRRGSEDDGASEFEGSPASPQSPKGSLSARKGVPDDLEAVTVCELMVEEEMLNVHGTFAGACAMLIVDFATFAPLFALSAVTGIDASGFSTAMNIVWHAPVVRGTTLKYVGTTLSFKGRTVSARCEVYDKKKGTLVISATHIIARVPMPLPTHRVRPGQSSAVPSRPAKL